MTNKLYVLNHWGYDTAYKWIFYGPDLGDKEEWRAFCASLMPDAARQAMKNETRDDGDKGFVSSNDIMAPLIELIEARGYVQLDPVDAGYGEVVIYREAERGKLPLGDAEDEVIAHNQEVEDRMDRPMMKKAPRE
jgi:hypothetical protein